LLLVWSIMVKVFAFLLLHLQLHFLVAFFQAIYNLLIFCECSIITKWNWILFLSINCFLGWYIGTTITELKCSTLTCQKVLLKLKNAFFLLTFIFSRHVNNFFFLQLIFCWKQKSQFNVLCLLSPFFSKRTQTVMKLGVCHLTLVWNFFIATSILN
jgi:hypothetical protein